MATFSVSETISRCMPPSPSPTTRYPRIGADPKAARANGGDDPQRQQCVDRDQLRNEPLCARHVGPLVRQDQTSSDAAAFLHEPGIRTSLKQRRCMGALSATLAQTVGAVSAEGTACFQPHDEETDEESAIGRSLRNHARSALMPTTTVWTRWVSLHFSRAIA